MNNNIKRYNQRRKRAKIAREKNTARPYKVIIYSTNDPARATVERFTTYESAAEYRDGINRDGGSFRAYIE